ncbi:FAST kinase domain-containing protein 5, mitochondrial-like [Liolophura sinensis]|uniref:FAST kinase domain-containing protein 5, mitochondrial-like n=1 Tax=Liolophura sinensis TaxID=3198878 RepID=UPI0031588F5C
MTSFVFVRLASILPYIKRCLLSSERRDSLKSIQTRLLNSTVVSINVCPSSTNVLSAYSSYVRPKGIFNKVLPNYFQTQQRNLLRHVRRPVPFNMAHHLYGQLIENHERIKPKNTEDGVSLLRRLATAGSPEEQIKTLSTSDIIMCLYAWREQTDLTSKTTSIVQSLYDDKKTRVTGRADANLLLQVELSKRVKEEDLETLFHCAHAAFSSRGRRLYFLTSFFDHILEEFDELSLTKSQFAKILFYIYYHGDAPERLLFNLQNYLSENMNSFDFNEVHVACLGFFRANKRINDYAILNALADRLLQNLNIVSGDALVSIMKTFRHSGFTKVSFFTELAERLTSMNLPNITSLNQVMHLAVAFGSLRLYHEAFLASLVSRSKQILCTTRSSVVRTKDLGRLVWALGTFCYKDEDFLLNTVVPVFTESLSRNVTVQYPESLVDVAVGMAYLGLYSDDIINAIFSSSTAAKLRGKDEVTDT